MIKAIHYGSTCFDLKKFQRIEDVDFWKPAGGF